jgi:ribosomal protein S18 acetylase RimI-like enzyme
MSAVSFRRATVADADAITSVHCESWHTTYPGLIDVETIAEFASYDRRLPGWIRILSERPDTVWVALMNDEVVGFADCGPARTREEGCDGQLFGIYLFERAQRRGIGEALVRRGLDDLLTRGFFSVRIEVFKGNTPAINFYKKLGAHYVREAPFEMMGKTFVEEIFVWTDIRPFIAKVNDADLLPTVRV